MIIIIGSITNIIGWDYYDQLMSMRIFHVVTKKIFI